MAIKRVVAGEGSAQGSALPEPSAEEVSAPGSVAQRDAQGRMIKGQSGNPAGRPKGSKNAVTLAQQALIEGAVDVFVKNIKPICQIAVKRALEGDAVFARLVLERVIPARKAVEHVGNTGPQGIQIIIQGTETPQRGVIIDAVAETSD